MEIIAFILLFIVIGSIVNAAQTEQSPNTATSDDNNYQRHETHDSSSFDINPANGNMMIGGIGGVDTFGNPYGTDEH